MADGIRTEGEETIITIAGQDYILLRREPESAGPRAGKADLICLRKRKGRVVFWSWDHGPSVRHARFEPPFKVGDDYRTFFGGAGRPGQPLFG